MFVWLLEGNFLHKNMVLIWKKQAACIRQGKLSVEFHTAQPLSYPFWRGFSCLAPLGPSGSTSGSLEGSLVSDYKVGGENYIGVPLEQGKKHFHAIIQELPEARLTCYVRRRKNLWRRDHLSRLKGTFSEVFRMTIRRDRLPSTHCGGSQWPPLLNW